MFNSNNKTKDKMIKKKNAINDNNNNNNSTRPPHLLTRNPVSRDTVTNLLQKLPNAYSHEIPSCHHESIKSKANEITRLLNCKLHASQSLHSRDSLEARYAVALERVLRQGIQVSGRGCNENIDKVTPSIRIPLKEIGKLVGLKNVDIKAIANAAEPYFDQIESDLAGGSITVRKCKRVRQPIIHPYKTKTSDISSLDYSLIPAIGGDGMKTSTKSTVESRQMKMITNDIKVPKRHVEEIRQLSIKLQSKLHNPDTVTKLAESIYSQYVHNLRYKKWKQQMNNDRAINIDLERNLRKYIGAFFFISAKECEDGFLSAISDYDRRKTSLMQSLCRDDKDGNELLSEETIRIDDVVNILRLEKSQFLQVLKAVLDNVRDINKIETFLPLQETQIKVSRASNRSEMHSDLFLKDHEHGSTIRNSPTHMIMTKKRRIKSPSFNSTPSSIQQNKEERYEFTEKIIKWRKRILMETGIEAQQAILSPEKEVMSTEEDQKHDMKEELSKTANNVAKRILAHLNDPSNSNKINDNIS